MKTETLPQHQDLEQRLNLLRPEGTIHDYAALLSRFYGFHRPWEERIWPTVDAHVSNFSQGRHKVPALKRDSEFLGVHAEALPRCASMPNGSDLAEALGCAYVLEGSTLGGQLLFRHFSQKFNLMGRGHHFFQGVWSADRINVEGILPDGTRAVRVP